MAMDGTADSMLSLFGRFGYAAIAAGVTLDSAGVPLPGEVVLLATGSLCVQDTLAPGYAIMAAAGGALFADSIWYYLGRRGARRLVALYCHFGRPGCVANAESRLRRFTPRSLLYARFVPGYRALCMPIAGMSGMSFSSFLLFAGVGALLWAATGVTLGALFAKEVQGIVSGIAQARDALPYLAAGSISLFALYRFGLRRLRFRERPSADTTGAAQVSPPKTLG
jgi:membrane protein DedA with SNARE-associated domain